MPESESSSSSGDAEIITPRILECVVELQHTAEILRQRNAKLEETKTVPWGSHQQSGYIDDVHERDKLLAEERRKHAEAQAEYHARCEPVVDSLFKFAERRHKAREEAIKQGKLVDVLRSDAALEGSVSNAEDIVESMLLKGGVDEPIAQLTRTVVSNLGRMFLGMGPSHRDIIETSRKLYGDERTPEQKVVDRERLMAAAEKLKVKVAKQQAEVKEQTLGDLLASGRMCGGIDKAEGVDL